MSDVKRWTIADVIEQAWPDWMLTMLVVPAADYDALLAERDALREAGERINHHLERAKVFIDSERYATCGQEIAGAHAALLRAALSPEQTTGGNDA